MVTKHTGPRVTTGKDLGVKGSREGGGKSDDDEGHRRYRLLTDLTGRDPGPTFAALQKAFSPRWTPASLWIMVSMTHPSPVSVLTPSRTKTILVYHTNLNTYFKFNTCMSIRNNRLKYKLKVDELF